MVQGLWCFLTALPVYLINCKDEDGKDTKVSSRDLFGWVIWLLGFGLQVTADRQKTAFRRIETNK